MEDALTAALAKDGGCTPAQLACLLADVTIPEGLALPGGVSSRELETYLVELVRRLRRAALPGPAPTGK